MLSVSVAVIVVASCIMKKILDYSPTILYMTVAKKNLMNKKLSVALVLLVTTMAAAVVTTIMTVKPVLALAPPTCQNCGASSLSPGTEAKSPGDAKNFAPGQEAKIPVPSCHNCAKDFAPGQEGPNAGIIGPGLKK
jgi:hypothetical protein